MEGGFGDLYYPGDKADANALRKLSCILCQVLPPASATELTDVCILPLSLRLFGRPGTVPQQVSRISSYCYRTEQGRA